MNTVSPAAILSAAFLIVSHGCSFCSRPAVVAVCSDIKSRCGDPTAEKKHNSKMIAWSRDKIMEIPLLITLVVKCDEIRSS